MKDTDTHHSLEEERHEPPRRQVRWNRRRSNCLIALAAIVLLSLLIGGLAQLFAERQDSTSGSATTSDSASVGTRVVNQVINVVPTNQTSVSADGIYMFFHDQLPGDPFKICRVDPKTKRVVWASSIGDEPGGISVVNGVVYVTSQARGYNYGYVYAFNAQDGTLFWKATPGSDIKSETVPGTNVTYLYPLSRLSTPTISNDTVYVTATDGAVVALNARDGLKRWMYDAHTTTLDLTPDLLSVNNATISITYPVTVASGIVYGGIHNKLFAINALTGKGIWSQTVRDDQMLGSPQVIKGVVYIGSSEKQPGNGLLQHPDGYVYAFDAMSGKQLWNKHTSAVLSQLAVTNGMIYFGTSDGDTHALDARNGREVWKTEEFGGMWYPQLQVTDSTVYTGKSDGLSHGLLALDAGNGSVRWHKEEERNEVFLEVVSKGIVYATLNSGPRSILYAFRSSNGSELWHHDYGSASWARRSCAEECLIIVP